MAKTVVIAMSGGVDSSVSAYLLKQQGFHVIALFMKNWEEEGPCTAAADLEDVASVCRQLDIPYYAINFAEEYRNEVFSHFLEELKQGLTPNPDVLCNQKIKFKSLLDKALELGADFLATGHYCQTQEGKLIRGSDPLKDQSYFLHLVNSMQLQRVLFPVGHLHKTEVRALAKSAKLPTATKKDSTGICFIGKRKFKDFLSQYLPFQPGSLQTLDGKIVGKHDGVAYYTIGQRKGLKIGGPGEAWFVVKKDPSRNIVFVAQGDHHPALFQSELIAYGCHWIAGTPLSFPFRCTAKIRYRQQDGGCIVEDLGTALRVQFDVPQRAITPSQSIVFYDGKVCLGGGKIAISNS